MEFLTCSKERPAANIANVLINGTYPQVLMPAAIPVIFASGSRYDAPEMLS